MTRASSRPLLPHLIALSGLLAGAAIGFPGNARAELQGRELDGNLANGPEAFFDTDLNVTWLRQASTSSYDWLRANLWAQQERFGITGWRLPTLVDISRDGCQFPGATPFGFSFSGGSDCGYNSTRIGEMGYYSELAQLYYVSLGNKAYYAPGTGAPEQAGWGLRHTGDFQGIQANYYWFDRQLTSTAPGSHWRFDMLDGLQFFAEDSGTGFALAVHAGDVAPVPEPGSGLLSLLGFAAIALVRRRRQHGRGQIRT